MRKAIEMERRLGLVLWFLATGADFRTIAHLFGVSKSTVSLAIKEVCMVFLSAVVQSMEHIFL